MSTPVRYRKKPVTVDATRWFENGDHPDDRVGEVLPDPVGGGTYTRQEGAVVRFFRRPEPEYAGVSVHERCGRTWHDHGWIDTLEGGYTVCPGDWIITGVQGERYPCKDEIFRATYEPVEVLLDEIDLPGREVRLRAELDAAHAEVALLKHQIHTGAVRCPRCGTQVESTLELGVCRRCRDDVHLDTDIAPGLHERNEGHADA